MLEMNHGHYQKEVTCTAVSDSPSLPRSVQHPNRKESLKQEIMKDVKSQLDNLAQELLKELKPLVQPTLPVSSPKLQTRNYSQQVPRSVNQWDQQGRLICRRCKMVGHFANSCRTVASPPALN